MVTKSQVMGALGMAPVVSRMLVDDQDVRDIMAYMPKFHRIYAPMYDKFAELFEPDGDTLNLEDLCYDLWEFCRRYLTYSEESEDDQRLSAPGTMLRRGYADCKGYSLFCAGVLDALRRRGWPVQWKFRYVPTSFWSLNIGHVFVVVDPNGQNIWLDPVLSDFNRKMFFWVRKDVRVNNQAKIAGLGSRRVGAYNPPDLISPPPADLLALVGAGSVDGYGTTTWIPDGYPLIPRPYLTTDGRLVLRPLRPINQALNQPVALAYLMAALQAAVNEYSDSPYNVNYSYKNVANGAADINNSLNSFISLPSKMLVSRRAADGDIDWLKPPPPESVGDELMAEAVEYIPAATTAFLNLVVPGLGNQLATVENAGGSALSVPSVSAPALQQIEATMPAPTTSSSIWSSPVLWIGGGLAIGLLIILTIPSGKK